MDTKLKVLLVEDHKISRRVALFMLRPYNFIIDCAATGQEAIEKFYNNTYDLILLDIGLPDMDGLEVTQVIRSYERENFLKKVFIFALTAHTSASYEGKALEDGMDAYLEKPLSIEKIQAKLQELNYEHYLNIFSTKTKA